MTWESFISDPFKNSHKIYDRGFLKIAPAPEYANGEVILASLYRKVGFQSTASGNSISERDVPSLGRKFQKQLTAEKRDNAKKSPSGMPENVWRRLVENTLRSPLQPNQSAKKLIQLSPLVPDTCIYSLSARYKGNPWDPGRLIIRMLQNSGFSAGRLDAIWQNLFEALSVDEEDDIWARFLQKEFESWRPQDLAATWSQPEPLSTLNSEGCLKDSSLNIPAKRFTQDLESIINLKNHLTRKQWVTMMESILRIGSASHVLWVCSANANILKLMESALFKGEAASLDSVCLTLEMNEPFWRYGTKALASIKQSTREYLKARIGINLILHQLETKIDISELKGGLSSAADIENLLQWLSSKEIKSKFSLEEYTQTCEDIFHRNNSILLGKRGITSNLNEFLNYSLSQRQTNEKGLESYDQGYFLAKSGNYRSAPWTISLGPVSVMSLVHACTHDARGPRTLNNFCQHLASYGIETDPDDISSSKLGSTMRSLGLVLDSPDAEGGIALINPFDYTDTKSRNT